MLGSPARVLAEVMRARRAVAASLVYDRCAAVLLGRRERVVLDVLDLDLAVDDGLDDVDILVMNDLVDDRLLLNHLLFAVDHVLDGSALRAAALLLEPVLVLALGMSSRCAVAASVDVVLLLRTFTAALHEASVLVAHHAAGAHAGCVGRMAAHRMGSWGAGARIFAAVDVHDSYLVDRLSSGCSLSRENIAESWGCDEKSGRCDDLIVLIAFRKLDYDCSAGCRYRPTLFARPAVRPGPWTTYCRKVEGGGRKDPARVEARREGRKRGRRSWVLLFCGRHAHGFH